METLDHTVTRRHGTERGTAFYLDTLRYAQSQWIDGKPAQALLQLNKAWMADLAQNDPILQSHPSPFAALVWIMRHSADESCGFLGDPVRHFQHLASRISGPRPTVRMWRAWVCMHLAEQTLPPGRFQRDGRQIAREGLWIPCLQASLNALAKFGWDGESTLASEILHGHKR